LGPHRVVVAEHLAELDYDGELTSAGLLDALNYVSRSFDERARPSGAVGTLAH
jgi:hypothetical protein